MNKYMKMVLKYQQILYYEEIDKDIKYILAMRLFHFSISVI